MTNIRGIYTSFYGNNHWGRKKYALNNLNYEQGRTSTPVKALKKLKRNNRASDPVPSCGCLTVVHNSTDIVQPKRVPRRPTSVTDMCQNVLASVLMSVGG